MRKKRVISMLLLAFLMPVVTSAQYFDELVIEEDLNAKIELSHNIRTIANGDTCALIIFSAPVSKLYIEGSIVHQEEKNGLKYVYISPKAEYVIVKSDKTNKQRFSIKGKIQSGRGYSGLLRSSNTPPPPPPPFDDELNKDNWSIGVCEKFISKDLPLNLSIHGGYVTNYVPIEFEATLGLKKSAGMYIYDSNGTIKDSYEYRGFRFTVRSGYCFEIDKSKRFMITPLGGFSYNVLSGSQIKSTGSLQVYAGENNSNASTYSEAKKSGNGGNALSFVGGVRLSYAVHEKWLLHVTPEYSVYIWKDDNFNYISKSDDSIKAWAEGFNISVGLIFRWER